jgi:hypothetical protein
MMDDGVGLKIRSRVRGPSSLASSQKVEVEMEGGGGWYRAWVKECFGGAVLQPESEWRKFSWMGKMSEVTRLQRSQRGKQWSEQQFGEWK